MKNISEYRKCDFIYPIITLSIVVFPLESMAKPPFNYSSAIVAAEETVKSDVPKSKRIYLFGPELLTETYMLNGQPSKHDVEMQRILSHDSCPTIASIQKFFPSDTLKEKWLLSIYRRDKSIEPIYNVYGQDVDLHFALRPGDVVRIKLNLRTEIP